MLLGPENMASDLVSRLVLSVRKHGTSLHVNWARKHSIGDSVSRLFGSGSVKVVKAFPCT